MTHAILQTVLALILLGLLLRVLGGQRTAASVARDTKSEAANAATDAAAAAEAAKAILKRLETLGGRNVASGLRIEDAAGVVAADLQAAHERADAAGVADHGAAADAAAQSPKETDQ